MTRLRALLDIVQDLLKGEPARAIGYGGAVIIYFVAKYVGAIPDQTFDQAVASAAAALVIVASIVETIRHYVYSPATVERLTQ